MDLSVDWTCYANAKSHQSCPTLCNPIDGSPPDSPVPGILKARTLEWVAISFSNAWKWKVKVKSLSHVQLLATLWTAAYQAPLSMGFSRQVYWSGVPLPSPRLDIAKENFWARGYTNGILKNQKAKRIETVKIAENIQRLWKKLKKVWHIHNRNTRLYIRDRNWRFIWNNNNWEFSQFNIRKQTTYPRNSENIKQNEFQ